MLRQLYRPYSCDLNVFVFVFIRFLFICFFLTAIDLRQFLYYWLPFPMNWDKRLSFLVLSETFRSRQTEDYTKNILSTATCANPLSQSQRRYRIVTNRIRNRRELIQAPPYRRQTEATPSEHGPEFGSVRRPYKSHHASGKKYPAFPRQPFLNAHFKTRSVYSPIR